MKQLAPLPVLVKTWLELLRPENEEEARRHAKRMRIGVFGSIELAIMHIEQEYEELSG
tara:strand:+ start:1283 stop:1456 length:174 start_codon:yes stop_codon:yes gene_type:complete